MPCASRSRSLHHHHTLPLPTSDAKTQTPHADRAIAPTAFEAPGRAAQSLHIVRQYGARRRDDEDAGAAESGGRVRQRRTKGTRSGTRVDTSDRRRADHERTSPVLGIWRLGKQQDPTPSARPATPRPVPLSTLTSTPTHPQIRPGPSSSLGNRDHGSLPLADILEPVRARLLGQGQGGADIDGRAG